MWVPRSHLCLAPHLQAHVCACTRVVQKCFLVQTRWGLCAQKEKEKQEKSFLLRFLSLLINPPACSHGCTNTTSLAERVPPLVTHRSCLAAFLDTNPGARAQRQPWHCSGLGRIRKHRPDLSGAVSQQHTCPCMGTVTLIPVSAAPPPHGHRELPSPCHSAPTSKSDLLLVFFTICL